MQEGVFQVIATGGDNMLGGDDIDHAIAEYICIEAKIELSNEVVQIAKKAKESFSLQNKVTIDDYNINISREKYESIIAPFINRTIKLAKNVLSEADNIDLDGIILVGGSTRIQLVSARLQDVFGVRIYDHMDPDKVVALGAALQANACDKGS